MGLLVQPISGCIMRLLIALPNEKNLALESSGDSLYIRVIRTRPLGRVFVFLGYDPSADGRRCGSRDQSRVIWHVTRISGHRKRGIISSQARAPVSTTWVGIGPGFGWPLGGPRVTQASPKDHAGVSLGRNGVSALYLQQKTKKAGWGRARRARLSPRSP